ncbi:unnamed protein product [Eruca vesicaria subsp. sativa]|uniref:Uncharacterized protein n=1 Tax=Eruca vesicaria subsp. sativa TaxID=29727 RepID=A0ABC8KB49_ERUVS|nr:unnamed protein product [Eruca vesicaria subsp. sativa]
MEWQVLLEIILVHNRDDWRQVSLVCKEWLLAESETMSCMSVLSYAVEPRILSRRCPNVKVLKIKGDNKVKLGSKATPWIQEITNLGALKSLEFSEMEVSDNDLHILATSKLGKLEALELYGCYGFSTDGLLSIAKHCKNLEKLVLDASSLLVKDGEWLHQISVHNHSLKVLNFHLIPNIQFNTQDLEAVAKNCPLNSLKIGLVDMLELNGFFTAAHKLQQFFGGSFSTDVNRSQDMYRFIKLPSTLCGLGNFYMKPCDMALLSPFADRIQYLDLRFALLGLNDQCHLLQTTPNLEVLELFTDIQDQVLRVIAKSCKKLKQLRILLGPDMKISRRFTQKGLISISQGCHELECIEVYILTIKNEALQIMGENLKNLSEFRLTLTSYKKEDKALPLDHGVRALLMGCTKMRKFKLYLREGDLTDVGRNMSVSTVKM